MINKRQILLVILLLSTLVTSAQFSIDVFYGYNHSKNEYVMPSAYDFANYQTYYSDIPYDTIYVIHNPDTVVYIEYEVRKFIEETDITKHSFVTHNTYGLNLSYQFIKYLKFGISFEKIGFDSNESSFKTSDYEDRFDADDNMFRSHHVDIAVRYNVVNTSLNLSILYPHKGFVFYLNTGINGYYSSLSNCYLNKIESFYDELHSPQTSLISTSYLLKYWGYSYGFSTGVGLSYSFYKNISIFSNVGYTFANLKFQKGEMTEYHYSFTNPIGETNTEEKELSQEIAPENIPFGKIKYNSLNFRLGIRYTFGKKLEE